MLSVGDQTVSRGFGLLPSAKFRHDLLAMTNRVH